MSRAYMYQMRLPIHNELDSDEEDDLGTKKYKK
jgi:hypothetical protein